MGVLRQLSRLTRLAIWECGPRLCKNNNSISWFVQQSLPGRSLSVSSQEPVSGKSLSKDVWAFNKGLTGCRNRDLLRGHSSPPVQEAVTDPQRSLLRSRLSTSSCFAKSSSYDRQFQQELDTTIQAQNLVTNASSGAFLSRHFESLFTSDSLFHGEDGQFLRTGKQFTSYYHFCSCQEGNIRCRRALQHHTQNSIPSLWSENRRSHLLTSSRVRNHDSRSPQSQSPMTTHPVRHYTSKASGTVDTEQPSSPLKTKKPKKKLLEIEEKVLLSRTQISNPDPIPQSGLPQLY